MNIRMAYSLACLSLFACGGSSSEGDPSTAEGAVVGHREPSAPQLRSGEYGAELALLVDDSNVTGVVRAFTGDVMWMGSKCEFTFAGTLAGGKVDLDIVKVESGKPPVRGRGLLEAVDAKTVKLTWKNGVSTDDPNDACLQVFGDTLDVGRSLERTHDARDTGITYRTIVNDTEIFKELGGPALETRLKAGSTVAVRKILGVHSLVKFTDWGYVNGESKVFEGDVVEGYITTGALVPPTAR